MKTKQLKELLEEVQSATKLIEEYLTFHAAIGLLKWLERTKDTGIDAVMYAYPFIKSYKTICQLKHAMSSVLNACLDVLVFEAAKASGYSGINDIKPHLSSIISLGKDEERRILRSYSRLGKDFPTRSLSYIQDFQRQLETRFPTSEPVYASGRPALNITRASEERVQHYTTMQSSEVTTVIADWAKLILTIRFLQKRKELNERLQIVTEYKKPPIVAESDALAFDAVDIDEGSTSYPEINPLHYATLKYSASKQSGLFRHSASVVQNCGRDVLVLEAARACGYAGRKLIIGRKLIRKLISLGTDEKSKLLNSYSKLAANFPTTSQSYVEEMWKRLRRGGKKRKKSAGTGSEIEEL